MSSIIVLDSSDEETDSTNKKPRVRSVNQSQTLPMARVNPVKTAPNLSSVAGKKVSFSNDNFKIHLPSKRAPALEPSTLEQVPPEKRVRRIKPTTVVRSNDEEWINRPAAGSVISRNGMNAQQATMANKNLVNPIRLKNPAATGGAGPVGSNPMRVIVNPAAAKSSANYVRVAWNGKDPKPTTPPVINKNISATVKEQPKAVVTPPTINKSITATVKDPSKVVSLSPPIFNKNSVTIRRVLVNDERPNSAATKVDGQSKPAAVNPNSTSIRRIPIPTATDPLKITAASNKPPARNTTQSPVLNTTTTSIRRIIPHTDVNQSPQSLPVLKKNTLPTQQLSSSQVLYNSPATIKRIVTVDLPKTPASPPVISKNYTTTTGLKKVTTDATKQPSMSMSVITKANVVKGSEKKVPPPVVHKPPAGILNRPSGLIVTPITCTASTSSTTSTSTPPPAGNKAPVGRLTLPNSKKQSKTAQNRSRSITDQSMAGMPPFNMFPPVGGFIGNPSMMYDMDPAGGAFINPAYIPNRTIRSMESSPNYPTMSPPVFNINYPSLSGGSITPVASPGTAVASPTSNRSTKSPVTSTVTRSSSSTRSPAAFMGMPIDVDQPMAPMSPPVYNMNNPHFNGDPFNFMRGVPPHTIPSPAYSPVRSTKSPSVSKAESAPTPSSDLDNFVRNPLSYPRLPSNTATSSSANGPIFSVDSPARTRSPTGFFKSPTSTITSPEQSTISEASSMSESLHQLPSNGERKSTSKPPENDNPKEDNEDLDKEQEKEPLSPEFETLLQSCRDADSSEDMNRLIDSKLVRYYYSVHPDFVKSRGFRKAVVAATDSIKKNPELVYYHLRPVVEEMKARKKSKAIVMTNDEVSTATTAVATSDEGIEEKVRNRQIRRLNKGLYILTRKIHRLENEDVDLDDENSTYLIVERYKKRACEIYDKICDLTGESKHALRQVKKPITFKETDYPKFNKVVETFVNRTKEFPDFFDVLRMLEFCNERYTFGLVKDEMTMIAQDAFIKIGKLLQGRRKADLYETVSHFTSDYDDPASSDPVLLAKLSENEKNQTSIGSIIDKYAREQVRRKAESANPSGDESKNSSESCDTDGESHDDDEQSNNNNNSDRKTDKESKERLTKATTNGTHSPQPKDTAPPKSSKTPPPPSPASTSAAFRTSPPHAFASPQASPRPRSLSPPAPPIMQVVSSTMSSLKILSVTSLNDAVSGNKKTTAMSSDKPAVAIAAAPSVDEIVISDEDL